MSGQGSSRLLAKRESMSLAEVDLINSNQFKHDQQKLQRHQAKLRRDYIETMLVHNREYSELKQFLHCIKQVSKEDDDSSVKSGQRPSDVPNKKGKKGKSQKSRKVGNNDDDSDNEDDSDDDDDDEGDDDSEETADDKEAKNLDKNSQGMDSKKAKIYLTRPNGIMRVNITPKSTEDKSDTRKLKVQTRLTSREQIDNSPEISESTRKTTARLTAINLNAMRDQFQRISSPLPTRNVDTKSGSMLSSNLRVASPSPAQRISGHNTLFPTNNQRMGATSPFHFNQNVDRPSSRRETSAFPANASPFTLSAPRRSSAAPPHSSFYPRPTSGLSDADFASSPVSNTFPGPQRPPQSREAVIGEGSVSSSARSASTRAPIPPKIGTKALQVLVASQKKILERRKSGENLSTRLMTPSECIEMQNRRRALMRISEEKQNTIPPNTPRIGPPKLSSYDKSKSF